MPRYIDADALLSKMPDDLPYKSSVKRVLMQATAADVAPKSEYERVAKELERVEALYFQKDGQVKQLKVDLEAMRGAANSYKMHYEKAKGEVAREIFAEIDTLTKDCIHNHLDAAELIVNLYMLKKKYTKD